MSFFPIPMVAAPAFGIAIGGHRFLALASLVVVLTVGTYLRRFGPRGFIAGMVLFIGDFFGFFLHGAVSMGNLGWLTAEIGVGLAVAIAVRFGLFYPSHAKALERTQRSYWARARKLARLALEQFDDVGPKERDAGRLHHQVIRRNEAALMIDAQLGDRGAVADGSSGERLHQRLFDVELALSDIARFAEAMGRLDLPADQRSEDRLALLDIVGSDSPGAKGHAANLIALLRPPTRPAKGTPSSAPPSHFGDALSGPRFYCYWAVLAAFIVFMGANNAGERLVDPDARADIERASATLHASLDVVARAIHGSRDVTYTRSAALFDRAARRLETQAGDGDRGQLALSDFKLIDGAMAQLAENMGLERTDFDTAAV